MSEDEKLRKPRVLIFDDNIAIIRAMEEFFKNRGYEVSSYTEPIVCPLYERDAACCEKSLPCADIVIADFSMPLMTGIELFERQVERGCKLDIRNKAIMSSFPIEAYEERVKKLGCAFFYKPGILSALSEWIEKREKYFDLSGTVCRVKHN